MQVQEVVMFNVSVLPEIWPVEKNSDSLQMDEVEYLMVKSLAHDAAISLRTSFSR